MKKPTIAIVRGTFLNRFEMQFFEPLITRYTITAFSSLAPYHDAFAFPVIKLPSPMDVPDVPYKMPILNRMFTDAHYLLGLERRLRGFDLVHTAETYFRYTQQCIDAKKKGYVKKVIATVLETIPFNNEGIWGRTAYKKRAREELDHIIALTQKAKESLIIEGADPQKITVIGHFVDTKRFAPKRGWIKDRGNPNKRMFTILFVGRLEEYKGVYDVVAAIDSLARDDDLNNVGVRVLFVGNGSQKRQLMLKTRQPRKNWHLELASATYDEMPNIYARADIFVAPSKPRVNRGKPTWEEQYCTALLEAQAAALPIVTTRSGGIPENVGNAAILIPPGNTKALAVAIKDFLLNPHKPQI